MTPDPTPGPSVDAGERECPFCGETEPHTMTHGLEGEPALWNDRALAANSPYAKCDQMTAEKWLDYGESMDNVRNLTAENTRLRATLVKVRAWRRDDLPVYQTDDDAGLTESEWAALDVILDSVAAFLDASQ